MRTIQKRPEPPSHRRLRSRGITYDGYPSREKDKLRNALVGEQGGICCYCCGPILPVRNEMKVEHWKCQENYPDLDMDYKNMMAACMGGEVKGVRKKDRHCDTSKGAQELDFCPLSLYGRIEDTLTYTEDGRIKSTNKKFNNQIENVLNLNHPKLRASRQGVMFEVEEWLRHKTRNRKVVLKEIEKWDDIEKGLIAYCPVAVWKLREHLNLTTR